MGIRTKLLSEHGVFVGIFSGTVTSEELRDYIDQFPTEKCLFLTYVEPNADVSQANVAAIPELRRAVSAKVSEHDHGQGFSAWVCEPGANEPYLEFWRRYREVGEHPAPPALFHTIEAACDWLGLPEAGRQAVIEAIET